MLRATSALLAITLIACLSFQGAYSQCMVCNGTCTATNYYYDYANFVCLACPAGCATCLDATTCTQCNVGYFLNSAQNCITCDVSNCGTCSSPGICATCATGYYLNNGACSSCALGSYQGSSYPICDTCSSYSTCTQCKSLSTINSIVGGPTGGSYITSGGVCTACSQGCTSCSDSGCSACMAGYVLSGSSCVSCPSNCQACDSTATTCTTCSDGYRVNNGTCVLCNQGCKTCTDNSTCTACSAGYFLNDQSGCTPCVANCLSCQDGNTCDKCSPAYQKLTGKSWINIDRCLSCPPRCSSCITTEALDMGICLLWSDMGIVLAIKLTLITLGAIFML